VIAHVCIAKVRHHRKHIQWRHISSRTYINAQ